jgi:hypothetical protein
MANVAARTEEVDSLVVCESKVRIVMYALGSLLLSIFLFIRMLKPGILPGFLSVVTIKDVLLVDLGAPITALLAVTFFVQLFKKNEVLALNKYGVSVRGGARIPWSEVAEIKPLTKNGKNYVAIVARDFEALTRQMPQSEANKFGMAQERFGAVAVISEEQLPMKVEQLMPQISAYMSGLVQYRN